MISPETLRKYPEFAGLDPSSLNDIAQLSEERSFQAGEALFSESGNFIGEAKLYDKADRASYLMMITNGEVNLTYEVGLDEPVIIGTLVAGDLLAVSALIPPYFLTTSAEARTDGSAIYIQAEEMRALLDENHELGYHMYKGLAKAIMSRLKATRIELAGSLA